MRRVAEWFFFYFFVKKWHCCYLLLLVDKLNTMNCMYTTPEYKYATANRIKSIPEELKLKPPVRVMAPVMPSKIIVF